MGAGPPRPGVPRQAGATARHLPPARRRCARSTSRSSGSSATSTRRRPRVPDDDDVLLAGVAAPPGVAEGPVRVIRGHHDMDRLSRATSWSARSPARPGRRCSRWRAAVVADGGGVLSHAAIAAREHGLPAVLGTGDATAVPARRPAGPRRRHPRPRPHRPLARSSAALRHRNQGINTGRTTPIRTTGGSTSPPSPTRARLADSPSPSADRRAPCARPRLATLKDRTSEEALEVGPGQQAARTLRTGPDLHFRWWRGQDLNLRPSGYEPDELPDCSTPRRTEDCTEGPTSAPTDRPGSASPGQADSNRADAVATPVSRRARRCGWGSRCR